MRLTMNRLTGKWPWLSLRSSGKRVALWLALVVLVAGLLMTLIWLAGRYEADQIQDRVDRDTQDAASEIRGALARNVQSVQALSDVWPLWQAEARELLRNHREIVMLEWRDANFRVVASEMSPFHGGFVLPQSREAPNADLKLVCERARRLSEHVYTTSYFSPSVAGQGMDLMEMCLPITQLGLHQGYRIAVYGLQPILLELVNPSLLRHNEVSFTEPDGTRLAVQGSVQRSGRVFSSRQLLDLSGNTMVLKLNNWRSAPGVFPNVLTALVAMMSLALTGVLFLLGRDINRRLRAERELANALAFRKAMEDSLVTGLRARDMSGAISYINPAFSAMTGFSAAELLGKRAPMPYWPPELVDEYQKRQAIRLSGTMPVREGYESVFMHKDGRRFPVLVFEAPLIDAQGQQSGWMSAILDISEQRRMEEQTRASQDRLQASARLASMGEMASLISHELNQPLAAISSYATGTINMLHNASLPPAEDLEHAMLRISEQAERAGRVIKSVHDFVRRRESRPESIHPMTLIESVMPLVQLQARKLAVQVDLHCPLELPCVRVDRTMVEQVLLNLARNAVQAMEKVDPRERTMQIRAMVSAHAPASVCFSVADSGQGIDDDTAAQLFTPFFSTKPEGMGLGLSLCRTVIEQHGGHLEFRPNGKRGTIFEFSLPVASSEPVISAAVANLAT
jgi:two-component system, LuxR family, sensor histidine kinase DctS